MPDVVQLLIDRLAALEGRVAALETRELPYPIDSDTYNDSAAKIVGTAADGGIRLDHLELGNVTGAVEGELRAAVSVHVGAFLTLVLTTATIASGAITVTSSHVSVDTEGGAATDDLTTISATVNSGTLLILRSAATARDVVVKAGTGNLIMNGDFTLATINDRITFVRAGSNWYEIARSDNS